MDGQIGVRRDEQMKKWVCGLVGRQIDKQLGECMGGRQGPWLGIVSTGHSQWDATFARQMTESEFLVEPRGTRSLQPEGQPQGPLGHDLESRMDVAS